MKRIDSLDFMRPRPRPWLGWAVAGAALSALALVNLPAWPPLPDGPHAQGRPTSVTRQAVGEARASTGAAAEAGPREARPGGGSPHRDAPWRRLFGLLERHADPRVDVLGVEAGPAPGQFRLTARCGDTAAMSDWLQRLERVAGLDEVRLKPQPADDTAGGPGVRFTVLINLHESN